MQQMMMGGMGGLGGINPAAAMQQQMMMQQMSMMGKGGGKAATSSGSSSCDEAESEVLAMPPMPPWMGMQSMFPGVPPPPPPPPGMHNESAESMGVHGFLVANPVGLEAAERFRALPPHLQNQVLQRGPVSDTRDPSAVLIARIRDVELCAAEEITHSSGYAAASQFGGPRFGGPPRFDQSGPGFTQNGKGAGKSGFGGDSAGSAMARRPAKAIIEKMISDYRLSPNVAWMLRALAPDKAKIAARIDPAGQADPDTYVWDELKHFL